MRKIEKGTRNNARLNVQRAILASVAAVGILSLAILAPNALQMLKTFGYKAHRRQKEVLGQTAKRLIKQGLISLEHKKLKLTAKGEARLRHLELTDFKLQSPKKWDKKWRVLIFDIPENRRHTRDQIRFTLEMIGFVWLQDSVWVYPYPCEDLITLLKIDYKLGKDLLYLIVEKMEGDENLLKRFNLNK